MRNVALSLAVVAFLAACASHSQSTHRGSLLDPYGYPPERHVTELTGRL